MSYKIREGLGFCQKNYEPCFNYNSDNFACSNRGFQLLQNVLESENGPHKQTPSTPYEVQFANRDYETESLDERKVGLLLPDPYNFVPQGSYYIFNSRAPRNLSFIPNVISCTSNPPSNARTPACCNRTYSKYGQAMNS